MSAMIEKANLIEVIDSLMSGEGGDAFAFLAEADPYLARGAADLRKCLDPIIEASRQRQAELAEALDELGATPRGPAYAADNQYLAFLSMGFLLAKLVEAKQNSIDRYERAMAAVGESNAVVADMLSRHLSQNREELEKLKSAQSLGAGSHN